VLLNIISSDEEKTTTFFVFVVACPILVPLMIFEPKAALMARPTKVPTPRFNLRSHDPKADRDKPTLIVLVFRYDGKRLVWSTQEKARPRFWDNKRNRVKITVNNSQDSAINKQLNEIANKAVEIFRRFDDGNLTIEQFKDELDYSFGRKKREVEQSDYVPLLQFAKDYIEKRKKAKNAQRGTWKVLQTGFNHLKKFAEEKYNGQLEYDDIDWDFRQDFEQWLYASPRQHSNNYAAKVLSVVKQFMYEASERDYHTNTIHTKRRWNIKKERVPKVVLSFDELETLYNLDLTDNPRLDRVRDLFLIGAYTGLRFSDFTRIKPEHIISEDGVEMIELFTMKTDTQVVIPFTPILKHTLEKYGFKSPKKISNQRMNEYLKELCEYAGINEAVLIKKSKGGKRVEENYKKYELITTHTARRSFATNYYQLGFPAIELMKITGHSTERQFRAYVNVDKRDNAKNMAARIAKMMGQSPLRKVE
jgi:integrase